MTSGTELSLLNHWQNFYTIMGTAAATLTGLMFVATTVVAGIDMHVPTANAGIAAFNTPTVVHFGTVLFLAGILSAPWSSYASLGILLGLVGLGTVCYSIIVLRRMQRMPHYQSTLEDWLWYMVFPLLANSMLIVAVFVLPKNPSLALYMIGFAMLLLLMAGIRNAWDNAIFLAVERAHADSQKQKEKPQDDPDTKQRTPSQAHSK